MADRSRALAASIRASLLAVVLLGCGDRLVDGDYRGEPLLAIDMVLRTDDGIFDPAEFTTLQLSLFWVTSSTYPERPDLGPRQELVADPERPGRWLLHREPAPAHLLVRSVSFELGLARLLLHGATPSARGCSWRPGGVVGGAEDVVLAYRRGTPSEAQLAALAFLDGELPPEGLSLLPVRPRGACTWSDAACSFVCQGCPDRLGTLNPGEEAAEGAPIGTALQAVVHRVEAPGRFRVPCF